MFYILIILSISFLVLAVRLIKVNKKLNSLIDENNLRNEAIKDNTNFENATNPIETIQKPIKVEVAATKKNEQQHYYIVKEILINKNTDAVISTNEYEFVNENILESKVEARLFYDNKIATCSNNDKNSVFEYELYIAKDIFLDDKNFNSISNVSKDGTKKYLLIDSALKTQAEGRDFESFVLRAAANKMNQRHDNQSILITTKNSFLDGIYKD
jgi:hypothetical protein